MRLVIGPTSAGKTTYLRGLAERESITVHQAHEVLESGAIPQGDDDVVHYNLLRNPTARRGDDARIELRPDLVELIQTATDVTVLMAPVPVLVARANERQERTADREDGYGEKWAKALKAPSVQQLCEHLALQLDLAGTPHRFLCSNAEIHGDSVELSRWDFPRLASADGPDLCAKGHGERQLDILASTYQADYNPEATGAKRAATLVRALHMPLAGKRLVDIGAAEGAASLAAVRMGAKVTAVEPRKKRFRQLRALASGLGVELETRNMMLDGVLDPSDSFDVVVCFNVIHHVPDPFAFLDRLADLTSSHLVLEYPGPQDKKFRATVERQDPVAEDLPMIGVSVPAADQTFVFTPAALDVYFRGLNGVFGHHEIIESPIADRWISVFSDKLKPVKAVEAELRAEVARLEQRIDELEASTSWRVTKPLRKAGALRKR